MTVGAPCYLWQFDGVATGSNGSFGTYSHKRKNRILFIYHVGNHEIDVDVSFFLYPSCVQVSSLPAFQQCDNSCAGN